MLYFRSIAFVLLNLVDILPMCGFQVKCSSSFTPRYFTGLVGYNHFPLSLSFKSSLSYFLANLNRISSVLLTLRYILFALSQLLKFLKFSLTCLLTILVELLKFVRFALSAE